MTITMKCMRCGAVITADGEDDLVTEVQAHHTRDHDGEHIPPRKHILARLRAQERRASSE